MWRTLDAAFLSPEAFAVTDEGFVVLGSWPSALVADAPMGLVRMPVPVLSFSRTGALLDTLAMAAGDESVRIAQDGGVADARALFGRSSHLDVLSDRIVLGDAVDLEFRIIAPDGRVERIVRGDESFDLSAEMLQAEIGAWLGRDLSPASRAFLAELPVPARRPAYIDLRVDATGAVWLADHRGLAVHMTTSEPLVWEVFDPDGIWLGQVRTPGRFTVHEIGVDYVLGVYRDELDVEHVQMLDLTR